MMRKQPVRVESLAEAFGVLCLDVPPGVNVEARMVEHTSND